MGFKVIWSEAAAAELEDICFYIAQDDPEAAARVARGVVAHIDLLVSFPFIGPVYQRGLNTTFRLIVFRSYRILYLVDERREAVKIVHIWHGARDETPN
jgi:toxin ParE1/3/4